MNPKLIWQETQVRLAQLNQEAQRLHKEAEAKRSCSQCGFGSHVHAKACARCGAALLSDGAGDHPTDTTG